MSVPIEPSISIIDEYSTSLSPSVDQDQSLENHLAWIDYHLSILSKNDQISSDSHDNHGKVAYIQQLLEEDLPDDLFDEASEGIVYLEIDGCGGTTGSPPSFHFISVVLNVAAMSAYTGKIEEAQQLLTILRRRLRITKEFFEDMTTGHLLAVSYATKSLQWVVNKVSSNSLEPGDGYRVESESSTTLQEEWEYIQRDREGCAVIEFFKGALGIALKVPPDLILELFDTAIYLNPFFHGWRYYTFRLLRMMRQWDQQPFRLWSREMGECEMAYYLAPDNLFCKISLVMIIMEYLWPKSENYWKENEKDYVGCTKLLSEAIENAGTKGMRAQVHSLKLYLGKLQVFGKGPLLDQVAGKRLLEECLGDRPECFFTLHSLAQLHFLGARITGQFKDLNTAQVYYRQALKANDSDFVCLVEYIEVLKAKALRRPPSLRNQFYREMLEVINDALKRFTDKLEVVSLRCLKACITWIFNPLGLDNFCKIALEEWVDSLQDFPGYMEIACAMILNPPFFHKSNNRAGISIPDLLRELEKMKAEVSIKNGQYYKLRSMVVTNLIRKFQDS